MGEKPDEVIRSTGGISSDRPLSAAPGADPVYEPVTASPGSGQGTEEIKAEIEETRAELSETIDAIQERLSPRNLMDQAKDTVKEATVGRVQQMVNTAGETASGFATQTREAAGTVAERVRENPIPATLIGLGLGWAIYRATSAAPTRTRSYYSVHEGDRDRYGTRDWEGDRWDDEALRARAGDYGRSWNDTLFRSVRDNPIPAALLGVGIGWLVKNARSTPGVYGRGYSEAYGGEWERSREWRSEGESTWAGAE
jgi:ElaB/YqjD/DUF883 family membrane-anchored ribosome-binding protein